MTGWHYSAIVAGLCFECLYNALICVCQSFWVHKKAPHWVRASASSPKFEIDMYPLRTYTKQSSSFRYLVSSYVIHHLRCSH